MVVDASMMQRSIATWPPSARDGKMVETVQTPPDGFCLQMEILLKLIKKDNCFKICWPQLDATVEDNSMKTKRKPENFW